MREELDAADGRVFVAQGPDSSLGQWPSLPNEHLLTTDWRAGFQVGLQCTAGRERQRHRPLFVALAEPKDHRAAAFTQHQVGKVQGNGIRQATAGVQEKVEDGVCPNVLPKLDLSKQQANLAAIQTLRGELLAAKLLHLLGRVRLDVALSASQAKKLSDRHEAAVDRRHGLAFLTTKVILEVGDVPRRHPA